jgi:hypothetical protein
MMINYTGKSKVIKRLCEAVNQLTTAEDALSKFDADGDGIVDNAAKGERTYRKIGCPGRSGLYRYHLHV